MNRSIGAMGLLLTSISAILGSGWLFSTYYSAGLAGPAVLLAWIIGGIYVIVIAFTFSEICAMIPVSGSSVRMPQYTHGTVVSFVFSWIIWLSYLALMATETQAVIQYASYYFPFLTYASGRLTTDGYIVAAAIMLAVSFINVYSIYWLIRFNSGLTFLKILVPVTIVIVVLFHYFDPSKILHPAGSTFLPQGFHGVFAALSTGGILFAYNAFKQAAELAGEAKNPHFAIPFALVGSVICCMVLYILLQLSFNVSINPENIVHGWSHLELHYSASPFMGILRQDKLNWLLPILYFGAIVAPFASSLMYCSSAGRSLCGMSKNGYLPFFLQTLSGQGNPIYAIWINFAFGMCLFAPLPGWNSMVTFLTSLLALTYCMGPICMLALRHQLPHYPRVFKLPLGRVWAFVAFYFCSIFTYFSGWDTLSKMFIAVGVALILLIIQHFLANRQHRVPLNWRESIWMWVYLIGLSIISYLGDYGGGRGILVFPMDRFWIALLSLICILLSTKFSLPGDVVEKNIASLHLEQTDQIK